MLHLEPGLLETDRLCLRQIAETDLPDLLTINGNAEVSKYLGRPPWQSLADAEAWFHKCSAQVTDGTALELVIILKEAGRIIGRCGLFEYEKFDAHATLGYVLGRDHWKQGHMREALTAFITHTFHRIGLRRIEARAEADNTNSTGLLKRLGFTQEGVLRERWITEGQPMDAHVFGLLAGEWSLE